jgi:glycine/D-amino acid oxidase-like deaminating enzyme
MKTTRRNFLKLGGATAGAALVPRLSTAAPVANPKAVAEPAREIPVAGEADVVVCGAGPAGVAAALAAARQGASTILLEVHGCLGGVWTAGALSWILDHQNKPGFMREILRRLAEQEGRTLSRQQIPSNAYDVEVMKLVLEDLCTEAGVQIHLHTRVCAVVRDPQNRVTAVITESKSGREAMHGKIFIDATGDGDVAAQAGCKYDLGHPETGQTQPMSLMALLTGINAEEIAAFFRDDDATDWAKPKDALRVDMERGGHSPSYAKPSLFRVRDSLFALMANHEYGVRGHDARDVTRATLHARKELHQLINGLRKLAGPWKNVRIVATGAQIGVREARRIHGRYRVTEEDLREGRLHQDAVCRVTFGIDVHATDSKKEKGIEKPAFRSKAYDIPVRALIAKDVSGLMMAGRCISGDFLAHSSYRVTGNAVAMGEAAGRVAAVAAATKRLPQEVKVNEWKG